MGDPETRIEVSRSSDVDDPDFAKKKKQVFDCARDKSTYEKGTPTTILRNLFQPLSESQSELMCQEKDEKGNTALHCAAKAGNLEICQFLVDKKGADIVAPGQNGMTPLQFASRYGCEENAEGVWSCMEWIMKEYEAKHKEFWQRLKTVIPGRRNEYEVLYDICKKDKYGFTILHHAIQNTNWAENTLVAKKLFQHDDFNMTETDKQGNTSLHMAAQIDKTENHKIFDVFFEGLTANKHMDNNDVFLHGAQPRYVEYLSNLKQCIQAANLHGKTPLHIACDVGNPESVEQLISSMKELRVNSETMKKIINSPDSNGHAPLHLAIESGNVDLMKILLAEGAQVSEETFKCAAR